MEGAGSAPTEMSDEAAAGSYLSAVQADRSEFAQQDDEPTLVPDQETKSMTIDVDDDIELQNRRRKFIMIGVIVVALTIGALVFLADENQPGSGRAGKSAASAGKKADRSPKQLIDDIKIALLTKNLNLGQSSLNSLETKLRGNAMVPVAKAILRHQFLYDQASARSLLEAAYSFAESDPAKKAAVLNLIGLYNFGFDPGESTKAFRDALAIDGNNPVYRFNMAMNNYFTGKQKAAIAELRKLKSGDNQFVEKERLIALGMMVPFLASRQFSQAAKVDRFDARIMLMQAIQTLNARRDQNLMGYFGRFIDQGVELHLPSRVGSFELFRYPDIYESARKTLRTFLLGKSKIKSDFEARLIATSAILAVIVGKNEEAEKTIERGLKDFTGNADLLKALGYLRFTQERYDDVIDIFRNTESKYVDSFAVQAYLGLSYLQLKRYQNATGPLNRLAQYFKTDPRSYTYLAELAEQVKGNQAAQKYFQKALDIDPYNLRALQGAYRVGMRNVFAAKYYDNLIPFF